MRSGILYAEPSFLEGMARVLDLGGTLEVYNTSANEALADLNALRSDWRALSEDFRHAIDAVVQSRDEGADVKLSKR